MKLRLPSLHEGVNSLSEKLDAKNFELDKEIFTSPIEIDGEADYNGQMVDVRLNIHTSGHFTCFRCAEDFSTELDVETRIVVLARDAEDSNEEESEGLIFIGTRGTEADLSKEIADAIVLDLPLKILCRPDCKGLCPYCYKDLNAGPCEHSAELDS